MACIPHKPSEESPKLIRIHGMSLWWIDPGKVIGGPTLSWAPEKDIHTLFQFGVNAILNLQEKSSSPSYLLHLATWEKKSGHKIAFLNIAILDGYIPTPTQAQQATTFIRTSLEKSKGFVYIHCAAGRGRTGTIGGCWLREQGIISDVILDLLQKRRSEDTSDTLEVPENSLQRKFVVDWPPHPHP